MGFFQRPPVAFYIENLEPGSSYRIILFAVNAKGRSEPTIIDDITFKGVAKFTGKSNERLEYLNSNSLLLMYRLKKPRMMLMDTYRCGRHL